jgi:hypothetical protein
VISSISKLNNFSGVYESIGFIQESYEGAKLIKKG